MTAHADSFVSDAVDATSWDHLEPLLDDLAGRDIASPAAFERWLRDRSDLDAATNEAEANLYITMTCRTDDKAAQAAYMRFVEEIQPRLKPRAFELDKRQAELTRQFPLDARRYEVLARDTIAAVELFRQENVPIQTEEEKLSTEYQQICGAMTVMYQGEERTLPQMGKYQESTDRTVREETWRLVADRRAKDAERIDGIFDRLVGLRDTMARNAGFATYVEYTFKAKRRFDYTPRECEAYHDSCARVFVPLMRRLSEQRKAALGVDELRPWDMAVDVKGREALRPFEGGVDLVRKSRAVFRRLDGRLAGLFETLGDGSEARGADDGAMLDLDSRRGKAPGGYLSMRDRQRKPFIFMNAAGLHRDVETMVHEAGHAFHAMLCADEPLVHYRHSPIEFAEVASMSMELLTMRHWGGRDAFYPSDADHARAQRRHLESSMAILPWIATIDAFQHWMYRHPTHTREERVRHWISLDERFGPGVSWSGMERLREIAWHRQPHLFTAPMYYIEYGIALLGSLQLWVRALEEGERTAVESYQRALSLGGSRPLPELFEAAGLKFDFSASMMSRLADRVQKELDKLPI